MISKWGEVFGKTAECPGRDIAADKAMVFPGSCPPKSWVDIPRRQVGASEKAVGHWSNADT